MTYSLDDEKLQELLSQVCGQTVHSIVMYANNGNVRFFTKRVY